MKPGTYEALNGDLMKVSLTATGYRLENLATGETTLIGGI